MNKSLHFAFAWTSFESVLQSHLKSDYLGLKLTQIDLKILKISFTPPKIFGFQIDFGAVLDVFLYLLRVILGQSSPFWVLLESIFDSILCV